MNYCYYGIKDDYVWCLDSPSSPWHTRKFMPRLLRESDTVWAEGPRGGVQIIKRTISSANWDVYGYITTNSDAMREFMWIKLRAVMLNNVAVK